MSGGIRAEHKEDLCGNFQSCPCQKGDARPDFLLFKNLPAQLSAWTKHDMSPRASAEGLIFRRTSALLRLSEDGGGKAPNATSAVPNMAREAGSGTRTSAGAVSPCGSPAPAQHKVPRIAEFQRPIVEESYRLPAWARVSALQNHIGFLYSNGPSVDELYRQSARVQGSALQLTNNIGVFPLGMKFAA
jgi:hypothetical protein